MYLVIHVPWTSVIQILSSEATFKRFFSRCFIIEWRISEYELLSSQIQPAHRICVKGLGKQQSVGVGYVITFAASSSNRTYKYFSFSVYYQLTIMRCLYCNPSLYEITIFLLIVYSFLIPLHYTFHKYFSIFFHYS